MNVYFTRHGETDWNKDSIILGVTDIKLNDRGVEQANILAEKVKNELPVDVIFSSPLCRALDTAKIISRHTGLRIITDLRLSEWDYGEFEGKDRDFNNFQEAKTEFGVRIGKTGESLLQLGHRVFSCLDDVIKNRYFDNPLLVSHGGVGRIVEAYFNNLSIIEFRELFIKNCEIRKYTVDL